MLQIGRTVVSLDLIEECFVCDLNKCFGICCVHGDSGAPLEDEEVDILREVYSSVKQYMQALGVESVEKNGTSVVDLDGDKVTPLIEGKECAYTYFENGIAFCAIEKAYFKGLVKFRKPISCHLYPVRVKKYPEITVVNYHRWDICRDAVCKGTNEKVPVYVFLQDALIRKFGQEWFTELKLVDEQLKLNPYK
jgi:hypothetical protein